jgi:D-alanyl-D-alanine carboxypeptidase
MPTAASIKFAEQVDKIIRENSPTSYRYVLCDGSSMIRTGAGGFSRREIDKPMRPARLEDRLEICSLSKMITAAAVLATLQEKNMSPDELVAPFFPSDWKLHDEVKKLTFRDFLTHKTGFLWSPDAAGPKQDGTSFLDVKKIVGQMPFNPIKTESLYRNVNFAVFRIVLPYLASYDRFARTVTLIEREPKDAILARSYVDIVNRVLLSPSGVTHAGCNSKTLSASVAPKGRPAPIGSEIPVLAYHFMKADEPGLDQGDRTLGAGSSGWCLSAPDLARVLQTLLFTEVVLSEKSRSHMKTTQIGYGCGMRLAELKKGSLVHFH